MESAHREILTESSFSMIRVAIDSFLLSFTLSKRGSLWAQFRFNANNFLVIFRLSRETHAVHKKAK